MHMLFDMQNVPLRSLGRAKSSRVGTHLGVCLQRGNPMGKQQLLDWQV